MPDVIRPSMRYDSNYSVDSADEVKEDIDNNNTVLNAVSSDSLNPKTLDGESLDSSLYFTPDLIDSDTEVLASQLKVATTNNLPLSDSENLEAEQRRSVAKPCYHNAASESFQNLNSSKTKGVMEKKQSVKRSPLLKFFKRKSTDDSKIAQVVHDLVFEKYEESHTRILNKLKKVHLTEEEKQYHGVVAELENVLKKRNKFTQEKDGKADVSLSRSFPTCTSNDKSRENAFSIIKRRYSSSDSEEVDLEVKPIGIPESGKVDRRFTTANFSSQVNIKNFEQEEFTNNKDSIKKMSKYLSSAAPVINVEAQVYTFCVEDQNQSNNCSTTDAEDELTNQQLTRTRIAYNKSPNPYARDYWDDIKSVSSEALQSPASHLIRSSTNQSEESDYNELKFLRNALGDNFAEHISSQEYIDPRSASIGTDDISQLLSSTYAITQSRRRCRRTRHITETNSNISESKSLSVSSVVAPTETTNTNNKKSTIDDRTIYPSYENITNFYQEISTNEGRKLITSKIFVYENIVEQALKALKYGQQKSSSFIGSLAHLELERILLVSKTKREVLIKHLYAVPDIPNEAVGRVTIDNVRFYLNEKEQRNYPFKKYYVCILQNDTAVFSTSIVAPNRLGWVDFDEKYIFESVPNTFSIKIEVHVVQVPAIRQNQCLSLSWLRSATKLPMMKLIGVTHIGIVNRKNKTFLLTQENSDSFDEQKLTASVQTNIKWPDTLKGYLTLGIEKYEHPPLWNRRWCVLENGKLQYYNYPSDENYCKPIGEVNMEICKSLSKTYEKILKPNTLVLFLDSGYEFKNVYLSLDSTEEYDLWVKKLEIILKLIKDWNMF